jgi:hypothetical protein
MIKKIIMANVLLCLLVLLPVCYGQEMTGTWSGVADAPDLWGGVELILSREADGWNAKGRLVFQGREKTGPVRDLRVDGRQVSFNITWWDKYDFRFNGQLDGNRLRGKFATEIDGKPIAGDWYLNKLTMPSASDLIELPAPTGAYPVGRTTFAWRDNSRDETETNRAGDKRELVVHVWYPATRVAGGAIYLPDLKAMDQELPRQAATVMRELKVAAQENAPLATSPHLFPIVIFSPGQGVKTLFYSALQTELASHGFVVVAIEHPYDAPVVVFPDGRIVRPLTKQQKPAAATTPSQDMLAQKQTADYRAQDIIFVKKKLAELTGSGKSLFRNRLDLSRVAALGHSLGGMAAMRACQIDASIRACVNIDGSYRARPYPSDEAMGHPQQSLMWLRRPLYMFTEQQLKGVGMTQEEFNSEISFGPRLMRGTKVGLDVQFPQVGLDHMDFSDVRILQSGVSPEVRAARLLTLQMTRDWVREFIQKTFDGRSALLLTGTAAKYREAHISLYD